jgi:hypothetical protein
MGAKIRLAWLLTVVVLVPVAAFLSGQIAFLNAHLTYLSLLLVTTAAATAAFRRYCLIEQIQPFWCIFMGLSAALISALL